jgi:hypothetical protein
MVRSSKHWQSGTLRFWAIDHNLVAKMLAKTKCPRLPQVQMRNFQKLVKYQAKFSKDDYHNKMLQKF